MMTNTPGVLDDTTADLAWALILAAARGAHRTPTAPCAPASGSAGGSWIPRPGHLRQDVGICGFGRIGRGVARRAMGFNMRVLYTGRGAAPKRSSRS